MVLGTQIYLSLAYFLLLSSFIARIVSYVISAFFPLITSGTTAMGVEN